MTSNGALGNEVHRVWSEHPIPPRFITQHGAANRPRHASSDEVVLEDHGRISAGGDQTTVMSDGHAATPLFETDVTHRAGVGEAAHAPL